MSRTRPMKEEIAELRKSPKVVKRSTLPSNVERKYDDCLINDTYNTYIFFSYLCKYLNYSTFVLFVQINI